MGQFNLSAPDLLGMEPRWQGQYTISLTDGVAVLQRIRPGSATLRKIHLYAQQVGGSNPGVAVELLSGEPMPLQTVGEYFPAVDVITTGWEKQDNGTTNLFATVDDRYDVSDYVRNNGAIGPSERRALTFRGTASAITGKRIQALVLTVNARMAQYRNTHFAKVRGFLDIGGQRYYGGDYLWANDANWYQPNFIAGWLRNPVTNQPWTLAEVNSIVASGSTNKFGVDVTVAPDLYSQVDDNAFSISGCALGTVEIAENRSGTTGGASKYQTVKPRLGWDAYQLTTDATLADNQYYWIFASAYEGSATATGSSLVIPRFNDDHGVIPVTDDATVTTHENREVLAAALQSGQAVATIPSRTSPVTTGMIGSIPFLLENSAGAIMSASQPYARLNQADIHTSSLANRGQRLTPASNKDYGAVVATVGWGSYNMPDAPLIIEARSAINGGSLLGTAILYPDPEDTLVRDRFIPLDATTSGVTGTPIFVHLRSSTTRSKPWRILQYDTRSDNIKTGSGTSAAQVEGATVNGTTDAYFESGALLTRYDLALALFAAPDVPTLTVTAVDAV